MFSFLVYFQILATTRLFNFTHGEIDTGKYAFVNVNGGLLDVFTGIGYCEEVGSGCISFKIEASAG